MNLEINPICPKCGHENDNWICGEGGNAADGDDWDEVCDKCRYIYEATLQTVYSIKSKEIEEDDRYGK